VIEIPFIKSSISGYEVIKPDGKIIKFRSYRLALQYHRLTRKHWVCKKTAPDLRKCG